MRSHRRPAWTKHGSHRPRQAVSERCGNAGVEQAGALLLLGCVVSLGQISAPSSLTGQWWCSRKEAGLFPGGWDAVGTQAPCSDVVGATCAISKVHIPPGWVAHIWGLLSSLLSSKRPCSHLGMTSWLILRLWDYQEVPHEHKVSLWVHLGFSLQILLYIFLMLILTCTKLKQNTTFFNTMQSNTWISFSIQVYITSNTSFNIIAFFPHV